MKISETATRSEAAYASNETKKSKTCHAMANADDMLAASGWTVLRRHHTGGQEIFAMRQANASTVWLAHIKQRTATLRGGDLECAVDRHLGKSDPETSASEFIEMVDRDLATATPRSKP